MVPSERKWHRFLRITLMNWGLRFSVKLDFSLNKQRETNFALFLRSHKTQLRFITLPIHLSHS